MKRILIFAFLCFVLHSTAQDEGYKNERLQKGFHQGYNYWAISSGFTSVENEFLVSISLARMFADQVAGGTTLSYNSNDRSKNEFMYGFFANFFFGKYNIKPVLGLKAEALVIPERRITNSLGFIERTPAYFGAKTSLSPGVSYLIGEELSVLFAVQLSYLPLTERNDILTSSVLPRLELAYSF